MKYGTIYFGALIELSSRFLNSNYFLSAFEFRWHPQFPNWTIFASLLYKKYDSRLLRIESEIFTRHGQVYLHGKRQANLRHRTFERQKCNLAIVSNVFRRKNTCRMFAMVTVMYLQLVI